MSISSIYIELESAMKDNMKVNRKIDSQTTGYMLQLKAMAIRGIHSLMPRFKIILSGESRRNYEL